MTDAPFDFPPPDPGTGASPAAEWCPLCAGPIPAGGDRCDRCSLHLGTDAPDRPRPMPRRALWGMVAGIAAVWALTLAVVAVIR